MPDFNNDNEKVLWSGGVNKKIFMFYYIVVAVVSIIYFSLVGILLHFLIKNELFEQYGLLFILLLILTLSAYIKFFIRVILLKKMRYKLTNKRIIVSSGLLVLSERSLYFADITGYEYVHTILDRIKYFDSASIDFSSPSIHLAETNKFAQTSRYCLLHIGKDEAKKVVEIIRTVKENKDKNNGN